MAGRNQHEIPRFYLRGFLIPTSPGVERIFQFRRGGRMFSRNIDKVGAGRDFYAAPDPQGGPTLDEEITAYERKIGTLVRDLRKLSADAVADAEAVAEVVAHLAFRNAHVRDVLAVGTTGMVGLMGDVLRDDELVQKLMGVDGTLGHQRFKAKIFDQIAAGPRTHGLDVPIPILERIAFARFRENFSEIMDEPRALMMAALTSMIGETPKLARDSHNKALAEPRDPRSPREVWLRGLTWCVVERQDDLVLPDCVALGVTREGRGQALINGSDKDVQAVLLPLTSRRLLVGQMPGMAPAFDLAEFNVAAARASHTYFFCASRPADADALVELIGSRSTAAVDEILSKGARGLVEREPDGGWPEGVFGLPLASQSWNYPVTLAGDFDQETGKRIVAAMNAIVVNASWDLPLGKVAAVTFADDVAAAVAQIEGQTVGSDVAMAARGGLQQSFGHLQHIVQDGRNCCHLVFHGEVGRALIGEDDQAWEEAAVVVAHIFARAGFSAIYEEAFSAEWGTRALDPVEGEMHEVMRDGSKAYLAARASAAFAAKSLEIAQANVVAAFKDAVETVASARTLANETGDYRAFWITAAGRVADLMSTFGMLIGSAEALGAEPLNDCMELEQLLAERGLVAWLHDFRRDLDDLWSRRGVWASYDALLGMDRHAERVLWALGVFLTANSNQLRVDVLPEGQDLVFAAAWSQPGFL